MITVERKPSHKSFHAPIGSVMTAALLAIGCNWLVAALKTPVAAMAVSFINFLLWRKHALFIAGPSFHWSEEVTYVLVALMLLGLGLRLAFWLHGKESR
jgi:hypothetical protein